LEGLSTALSSIDKVIQTIKKSKDREAAKENLKKNFKFTEIASELGNARTANMVALGAYLASKKLLSLKNILKLLPEAFKNNKKLQVLNEQAIKAGMNLIK